MFRIFCITYHLRGIIQVTFIMVSIVYNGFQCFLRLCHQFIDHLLGRTQHKALKIVINQWKRTLIESSLWKRNCLSLVEVGKRVHCCISSEIRYDAARPGFSSLQFRCARLKFSYTAPNRTREPACTWRYSCCNRRKIFSRHVLRKTSPTSNKYLPFDGVSEIRVTLQGNVVSVVVNIFQMWIYLQRLAQKSSTGVSHQIATVITLRYREKIRSHENCKNSAPFSYPMSSVTKHRFPPRALIRLYRSDFSLQSGMDRVCRTQSSSWK